MNKNETRFGEDARSAVRRVPGDAEGADARTRYADIIDRPHHVSAKRPQMDRLSRAAQFSSFAALTGYEDLIREAEKEVNG